MNLLVRYKITRVFTYVYENDRWKFYGEAIPELSECSVDIPFFEPSDGVLQFSVDGKIKKEIPMNNASGALIVRDDYSNCIYSNTNQVTRRLMIDISCEGTNLEPVSGYKNDSETLLDLYEIKELFSEENIHVKISLISDGETIIENVTRPCLKNRLGLLHYLNKMTIAASKMKAM